MIRIVTGALSPAFIAAIKQWLKAGDLPLSGTNLSHWDPGVVKLSGAILLRDLVGFRREWAFNEIKRHFPDLAFSVDDMAVTHTMGSRLSYVPWHADAGYRAAMTIYLNERWERDWSGWLIAEEGGGFKAYLPEHNVGAIITPPLQHCTTMPSLEAPLRETLQVFIR